MHRAQGTSQRTIARTSSLGGAADSRTPFLLEIRGGGNHDRAVMNPFARIRVKSFGHVLITDFENRVLNRAVVQAEGNLFQVSGARLVIQVGVDAVVTNTAVNVEPSPNRFGENLARNSGMK